MAKSRAKPMEPPTDADAGFLAAIRATPGDAGLRLVYADWLEERGDPRAELIRLQEEMATLLPSGDRYASLKPRRAELRSRTEVSWLEAMDYLPKHRPLFQRLPERRVERWRLVEEFIDVWYGPLQPGDGYSEAELAGAEARLGLRLPVALREWYGLAGKRKEVWSNQDLLLTPDKLQIDEQRKALVVRAENQWCEQWAVRLSDLALEDPPIIELSEQAEASPTTTAFAIQVLVYEVKFTRKAIWAGCTLEEEEVQKGIKPKLLGKGLRRCALPQRYWLATPLYIFEGPDLLVESHGRFWIYTAARSEKAMEQLNKNLRGRLEVYP
jgi:uncharacterized protein (TIGR02996 family)